MSWSKIKKWSVKNLVYHFSWILSSYTGTCEYGQLFDPQCLWSACGNALEQEAES